LIMKKRKEKRKEKRREKRRKKIILYVDFC
jgi:hypothetical protein